MIVVPHSMKLLQSWDTGSDQPRVIAFFTYPLACDGIQFPTDHFNDPVLV